MSDPVQSETCVTAIPSSVGPTSGTLQSMSSRW